MLDKQVCLKCPLRTKYLKDVDFNNIWDNASLLYCPLERNPFTKIPIPITIKSEPPAECHWQAFHFRPKNIQLPLELPPYKGKPIEVNWKLY